MRAMRRAETSPSIAGRLPTTRITTLVKGYFLNLSGHFFTETILIGVLLLVVPRIALGGPRLEERATDTSTSTWCASNASWCSEAPSLDYSTILTASGGWPESRHLEWDHGLARLSEGIERARGRGDVFEQKLLVAELAHLRSRVALERSKEVAQRAANAIEDSSPERQRSARPAHEGREYALQAVELYSDLRVRFPNHAMADFVLSAIGQTNVRLQRIAEATEAFTELVERHAESPFAADAWLALGEIRFDAGAYEQALAAYSKAEDKRSRVYRFALYKQGWSYYKLSRWQSAMFKFETLLSLLACGTPAGVDRLFDEGAIQGFVKAYSHLHDVRGARFVISGLVEHRLQAPQLRWYGTGPSTTTRPPCFVMSAGTPCSRSRLPRVHGH